MQGRGHLHFFEKGWTKLSFSLELGEAWNYPHDDEPGCTITWQLFQYFQVTLGLALCEFE